MTTLYPTILHDKAVCVSKNEKFCTKTAFIKKNVAHVQHFYLFADRGLEHARRNETAPLGKFLLILSHSHFFFVDRNRNAVIISYLIQLFIVVCFIMIYTLK